MNCPFHIMIYKTQTRSYRDLPLRWAELGTVYRYERSGVLHGLLRVRGFTQDDAHIICTPEQIETRSCGCCASRWPSGVTLALTISSAYLATRSRGKGGGRAERWEQATESLRKALEVERAALRDRRGGRRLLRAQDRPQDPRRPGPRVADDDDPVRFQRARAL
jgi:threonyl-tRNA synthetase